MSKNNAKTFGLVTGALASLVILLRLIFYFIHLSNGISFVYFLYVIGFGAIAFAAFTDRKDYVAPAGFAFLALMSVVSFISNLISANRYGYMSVMVTPSLTTILTLLGYLAAAFVLLTLFTDLVPSAKEICKKLWFVPAIILFIAGFIIYVRQVAIYRDGYYYYRPPLIEALFYSFIRHFGALQIGTFVSLLAGLWAVASVSPETAAAPLFGGASAGAAPAGGVRAGGAPAGAAAPAGGEGYYALTTHILLLLLTCGVWYYIWIYRTTDYLNRAPGEPPRNATTELLLCLFVPFYAIFWIYKSAQRIDRLAASKGVQSDLTTLCLILAIFIGIVPPILMQDKINAIAAAAPGVGADPMRATAEPQYTAPVQTYASAQPTAPVQQAAPVQVQAGVPEQLAEYKELLDAGAITQEDYDALKKRLLGL